MTTEEEYIWLCTLSGITSSNATLCEGCVGGFNCVNTIITRPSRVQGLMERFKNSPHPPRPAPHNYFKKKKRLFDNRKLRPQDRSNSGKREAVYKRDGYRCLKCGCTENLTLDHVLPRSKGGSNEIENLQTLCKPCNEDKADTYIDYREVKISIQLLFREGMYPKQSSQE